MNECFARKYRPKETKKVADPLVAYPALPKTPMEPLNFSGQGLFGDGHEVLPHHILGSLEEFKKEALARGNTQVLKFCVQEEITEGRITEASSSIHASADGIRLAREVLVLQPMPVLDSHDSDKSIHCLSLCS
ncbi:MYCBP-associated protein-like [Podargus strigoides]